MRQRNWWLVVTGFVAILGAAAFFFGMAFVAPRSTDPVALMQTVGQAAGVVSGIGLVMMIFGLIGKKS